MSAWARLMAQGQGPLRRPPHDDAAAASSASSPKRVSWSPQLTTTRASASAPPFDADDLAQLQGALAQREREIALEAAAIDAHAALAGALLAVAAGGGTDDAPAWRRESVRAARNRAARALPHPAEPARPARATDTVAMPSTRHVRQGVGAALLQQLLDAALPASPPAAAGSGRTAAGPGAAAASTSHRHASGSGPAVDEHNQASAQPADAARPGERVAAGAAAAAAAAAPTLEALAEDDDAGPTLDAPPLEAAPLAQPPGAPSVHPPPAASPPPSPPPAPAVVVPGAGGVAARGTAGAGGATARGTATSILQHHHQPVGADAPAANDFYSYAPTAAMLSTMRTLDALARDLALHDHLLAADTTTAAAATATTPLVTVPTLSPSALSALSPSSPGGGAVPAALLAPGGSRGEAASRRWTWSATAASDAAVGDGDDDGGPGDASAAALRRLLQLTPAEAASPRFAHLFGGMAASQLLPPPASSAASSTTALLGSTAARGAPAAPPSARSPAEIPLEFGGRHTWAPRGGAATHGATSSMMPALTAAPPQSLSGAPPVRGDEAAHAAATAPVAGGGAGVATWLDPERLAHFTAVSSRLSARDTSHSLLPQGGSTFQWQRVNDGSGGAQPDNAVAGGSSGGAGGALLQPDKDNDWLARAHSAAQQARASASPGAATGSGGAPVAGVPHYHRASTSVPAGAFDGVAAVATLMAFAQRAPPLVEPPARAGGSLAPVAADAGRRPVDAYLARSSSSHRHVQPTTPAPPRGAAAPLDAGLTSHYYLSPVAPLRAPPPAAGSGSGSDGGSGGGDATTAEDALQSRETVRGLTSGVASDVYQARPAYPAACYRPRPLLSATGQPLAAPSSPLHQLPLRDVGGGATGFGGGAGAEHRIPVRVLIRP